MTEIKKLYDRYINNFNDKYTGGTCKTDIKKIYDRYITCLYFGAINNKIVFLHQI